MNKLEKLIKKHYNKYNGGFEDGYEQAIEVGCDDEIILLREFTKELFEDLDFYLDSLHCLKIDKHNAIEESRNILRKFMIQ